MARQPSREGVCSGRPGAARLGRPSALLPRSPHVPLRPVPSPGRAGRPVVRDRRTRRTAGHRRAGCAVALRPGAQGLRGHRAQHDLEGVVHGRQRRAERRLLPNQRQHQRRDAAVPRQRRLELHRPADARHDLHGPGDGRPSADLPCHDDGQERALQDRHRLHHRPLAPDRAHPLEVRRAEGPAVRLRPVRPSRPDAQRQRRRRQRDDRQRRRRRRRAGQRGRAHGARRLGRGDEKLGREPRLRHPGPLGAGRQPRLAPGDQRLRRPAQRRPRPARQEPHALRAARQRRARQRRAGRARAARPRRPLHPRPRLRRHAGQGGLRQPGLAEARLPPGPPRLRARAGGDSERGWNAYDASLVRPRRPHGASAQHWNDILDEYYLSANYVKAAEDKTFPGAIAASLTSPWGQAVSAGDPKNTYFGSYREVFARDLYEAWTAAFLDGDRRTATDMTRFLFERQQQADGSMPRNSLPNGKLAPDSFNTQLDECAYPLIMALAVGLTDNGYYKAHIAPAANFVASHGPAFGPERWEEQSGFSPSTISAEIAGLIAAAIIADENGDHDSARVWRATADEFQRNLKKWTLTTNGPLGDGR